MEFFERHLSHIIDGTLGKRSVSIGYDYQAKDLKSFGLKPTSRLKDFTFKFITVPAKRIKTARLFVLNIYTELNAYATVLKSDFG